MIYYDILCVFDMLVGCSTAWCSAFKPGFQDFVRAWRRAIAGGNGIMRGCDCRNTMFDPLFMVYHPGMYIIYIYTYYDMYIYICIHFEGDGKQIPDIKIPLHNRMEHNLDGFSPLGLTLTPRRKEATSMGDVMPDLPWEFHKWQHSSRGILYTHR